MNSVTDAPARLSTSPNFAIPDEVVLLRWLRRQDRHLVADMELALVGAVLVDDDLIVGRGCMAGDEMELVQLRISVSQPNPNVGGPLPGFRRLCRRLPTICA